MNLCKCLVKTGNQCTRAANVNSNFCWQHQTCKSIVGQSPARKSPIKTISPQKTAISSDIKKLGLTGNNDVDLIILNQLELSDLSNIIRLDKRFKNIAMKVIKNKIDNFLANINPYADEDDEDEDDEYNFDEEILQKREKYRQELRKLTKWLKPLFSSENVQLLQYLLTYIYNKDLNIGHNIYSDLGDEINIYKGKNRLLERYLQLAPPDYDWEDFVEKLATKSWKWRSFRANYNVNSKLDIIEDEIKVAAKYPNVVSLLKLFSNMLQRSVPRSILRPEL